MYCPSCGAAFAQGLIFCKHCGARLTESNDDFSAHDHFTITTQIKPQLLVPSMAAVFILGLMLIIVFMGVMKSVLGLNNGLILAFALISFVIMLLIECVFIRLLFVPIEWTH
jgi:zinc-ribbon domain